MERALAVTAWWMLVWLLFSIGLSVEYAHAHTRCDGTSASKIGSCCGEADSLNVPISDVSQREDGVWLVKVDGVMHPMIDESGKVIPLLPQDDKDHGDCYTVWYRRQDKVTGMWPPDDPHGGGGEIYHFYCLQGPLSF